MPLPVTAGPLPTSYAGPLGCAWVGHGPERRLAWPSAIGSPYPGMRGRVRVAAMPLEDPKLWSRRTAQIAAAVASVAVGFSTRTSGIEGKPADKDREGDTPTRTMPTYRLNDGNQMPALGFGTYRVPPGSGAYDAVREALRLGYRMIDTAEAYANEADVGRACRDSGIPRDSLFIASKLLDTDHSYRQALRQGRRSVEELGLGYIDLFLIHSPGVMSPNGGNIVETYDALLQLQREGLVRSVGVSNFGIPHLEALKSSGRPIPPVNQFELHPLVFRERAGMVEYCQKEGILVQAYGSILSGRPELSNPVLTKIAAARKKTPAQILLRWALDQGFQVIPKSTRPSRMLENIDVFDFALTSQELGELNNIGAGRLSGEYWGGVDPFEIPVSVGNVGPKVEASGNLLEAVSDVVFDAASDATHAIEAAVVRSLVR